jgi:hypothetical protein
VKTLARLSPKSSETASVGRNGMQHRAALLR